MKSRLILFIILTIITYSSRSQVRVEPPSWWAGMKCQKLQLMVHAENISETNPVLNYPGLTMESVVHVENPNYLFINLKLATDIKPGNFNIEFEKGKKVIATFSYEINQHKTDSTLFQGFDNSDVIYLLMPDRFANGDPSNDNVNGMLEIEYRSNPSGRHGGDIKGIVDHLDYFVEIGVTAL